MRINLEQLGAVTDLVSSEMWDTAHLATQVSRRTSVLARLGLKRDGYAVLAHGNTPTFFADLLAIWQTGACAVCANPGLTAGELTNVVEFIEPGVVLVDESFALDIEGLQAPLVCTAREPASTAAAPTATGAALDDPALILFTSGTTGQPKGVVHTFRSLFARLALNQVYIGKAVLARTLCVLPTHFGHGLIGNCLTPLFAGCEVLLYPDMGVRGAAGLGQLLDARQPTFMSSVPAFWKLVLKLAKPPTSGSLRQVHIGSAPLSAELWRAVVAWTGTDNVVNMYGITETANWVAGISAHAATPEDGLIGPVWGGSAAVMTADSRLSRQGEGELLLQVPTLFQGYHRRPELTAQVLRDGWFHTGDIGVIDAAGHLRLTGRQKYEINRAGIKIHPEEVELLLERHPQVLEACAFGLADAISGEIVAVAVRLAADSALTPTALRQWCAERIRREAVPEQWFFVTEIPKTDRGKIKRQEIMAYCLAQGERR